MREFERRMANMKLEQNGDLMSGGGGGGGGLEPAAADYLTKVGQTGTLPAHFRHAVVVRPMTAATAALGNKQLPLQQQQQLQSHQLQQQQLLMTPPQQQQQVRRSSLTSQSDLRQSPFVDSLAYYGPNVRNNIAAFGTLSAAQSQQMRQALSQRLNNQNNQILVNGSSSNNGSVSSSSNNNPRLSMRVMSPQHVVAGNRVALASKQQQLQPGTALNGSHQRSKSVPRNAPSEMLQYDPYGAAASAAVSASAGVVPQLHSMPQQRQRTQLVAHPLSIYGSPPGRQDALDMYAAQYQTGAAAAASAAAAFHHPYDVGAAAAAGYPATATGVNYAVVYDNPYASLARPSAATPRYSTASVASAQNYGTLPTKGVLTQQQQWRRQTELAYQQQQQAAAAAVAYPVPIVYDPTTGAYYAADATAANPQLQHPVRGGVPIWSESDQAYVAADGGLYPAFTAQNQVSYVVDPALKSKQQMQMEQQQQQQQQHQRVPGRQVFIPEPDYPGAAADGFIINGTAEAATMLPPQQQPSSAANAGEKKKPQQPQQMQGQQQLQQNGLKKKTVTFAPFVTEASPEGTQTEKYSKLPFQNNAEFVELDSIQL